MSLINYADKYGYMVVCKYVDEAESGRVADRTEFNRMIDEARSPKEAFRETLLWRTAAKEKADPVRVERAFPAPHPLRQAVVE